MSESDIATRMKANYEDRGRYSLVRRMPVVIRVDGRAFHTYTRGMGRPFDDRLMQAMVGAALDVCDEAQGCVLGYVQSDEASFLLVDYQTLTTAAWFDYTKSKVETIAASVMTARFNQIMGTARLAHFDARSFNIPREDAANYLLWRAMDWERNSLSMLAQAHFSPKQLHGKGRAAKHEMLHELGINWATDTTEQQRNGTWLVRGERGWEARHDIQPEFAAIDAVVSPLVDPPSTRPTDANERESNG
jgi:tRNA(His) guanylyltransferase